MSEAYVDDHGCCYKWILSGEYYKHRIRLCLCDLLPTPASFILCELTFKLILQVNPLITSAIKKHCLLYVSYILYTVYYSYAR